MQKFVIALAAYVLLLGAAASAQESRSDIALQGTGFFTKDTTSQGTTQKSTNTGGFLVNYRYHFNRWLAGEAAYGYDRSTEQFFAPAGLSRIQANVHQATGGFVFSLPMPARYRISPYLLAEGGALVFDPTDNAFGTVSGAQRQAAGVFVYGVRTFRSSSTFHYGRNIAALYTTLLISACEHSATTQLLIPPSLPLELCSDSEAEELWTSLSDRER